jgi:hypothetical protein
MENTSRSSGNSIAPEVLHASEMMRTQELRTVSHDCSQY